MLTGFCETLERCSWTHTVRRQCGSDATEQPVLRTWQVVLMWKDCICKHCQSNASNIRATGSCSQPGCPNHPALEP